MPILHLQLKTYVNKKTESQKNREARMKDRKFLDALATDKFYLEKLTKHLSSDVGATSRGSREIASQVT